MQCRLGDDASFDATLVRYIAAATSEIEQHTGLILAERTMLLRLDGFPAYDIDLQTYPVQSITSIKYDDSGNVETTLAATEYFTQLSGPTPFVRPVSAWPSTYLDKPASVRITMIVGYPEIDQIPEDLKQAVLFRVFDLWDQPGSAISTQIVNSRVVETITNKYRRYR
jgi:uncharacterized phiE125 gp8 family phage protein